jgi:hypothetical protein
LFNVSKYQQLVVLHSNINSLKSGLLHFTGQPYGKKSRSAKDKDGIINLIVRDNLVDRYSLFIDIKLGYCAVLATCQSDEKSTANNRENILV